MLEIEAALYQKLTADAALTSLLATPTSIYNTIVPQGSAAPYVVFSEQASVDHHTVGRASAWELVTYQVKALTESQAPATSSEAAEAIRAAIDLLLNDGTLTVAGYSLMVCRRVNRIKYPEVFDGLVVWHVGSTYQIGVST